MPDTFTHPVMHVPVKAYCYCYLLRYMCAWERYCYLVAYHGTIDGIIIHASS